MHDDLPAMDDDDLRRGLPTCHIKFGEANAILAGDALQTLAFSILSDAPMVDVPDRDRLAMVSELAQASGVAGMCGGQALDLQAEDSRLIYRRWSVSIATKRAPDPRRRPDGSPERRRTRPRCPARAGSLCGKYRSCLPRSEDDILDVVGDTATLGKRQGADQQWVKSTYPALLGLEQARKKAHDLIADARRSLDELAAQSLDTSALEALANYIIQRDK